MANRTSCILSLPDNPLVEDPDLVPLGLDPRVLIEEASGTITITVNTITIKSGGGIQITKID
jgi:hypothetical protein